MQKKQKRPHTHTHTQLTCSVFCSYTYPWHDTNHFAFCCFNSLKESMSVFWQTQMHVYTYICVCLSICMWVSLCECECVCEAVCVLCVSVSVCEGVWKCVSIWGCVSCVWVCVCLMCECVWVCEGMGSCECMWSVYECEHMWECVCVCCVWVYEWVCACVPVSVRVSEHVLQMRNTPGNPRDLTEGGSSSVSSLGSFHPGCEVCGFPPAWPAGLWGCVSRLMGCRLNFPRPCQ